MRLFAILAAVTTLAALVAGGTVAPSRPQTVPEFLRERAHFSEQEIAAIEAGEAEVELLPGRTDTETRVLGVVKIEGSPEAFVDRYRDIVSFERGSGVLEIGRFSTPPRLEDLASLTLDPDDLEGLRECRPGDCSIKLDAERMEAFQSLDWSAPYAPEQARNLARQMIVDFLKSYQRGGNRALGAIHDKKEPLLVGRQFADMVKDPDLPVYFPALYSFLLDYPRSKIPGAEEIFYWSKVDIGLKPMVRLNHVVIYEPREIEVVKFAIASKMLWASHYFNTGLEMKFLAVSPDSPGFYYLIASNRSRSDGLTGFTGALLGGTIRAKARDGLRSYLRSLRSSMESAAALGNEAESEPKRLKRYVKK